MNANPWSALKFTIVLPPRGQARARAMVLQDKAGNPIRDGRTGRCVIIHHKDKTQEQDEKKLEALMMQHRPDKPLDGPIKLGVRAVFPIPQSMPEAFKSMAPEKGKAAWFREAARSGEVQPVSKPDLDNIIKHVKDCATGVFWPDDKSVVGYLNDTGKYYGDPPRYEITILYRRDLNGFEGVNTDESGGGL